MSVKDSASLLSALICPHGPSFRPDWYTNVGVAEMHGDCPDYMVLYAADVERARKFLAKHCVVAGDEFYFGCIEEQGMEPYKVVVKECGPIMLCGDEKPCGAVAT